MKESIDTPLTEATERIAALVHPEKIILFGSRARGDARPDSDIDLLVVCDLPPGKTRRECAVRLYRDRFYWEIDVGVDIIVRTPRDIERALEEDDFFYKEILAEGQVLYERNTESGTMASKVR